MLAGFGIGRVVDDKHPVRVGQGFGHDGPVLPGHGRVIPAALVDELLEGLLGIGHRGQFGRQAHPARERFNGFTFALLHQAAQVDLGPEGLARAVKMGAKTVSVRLQPLEHGRPKPGRESAVHSTPPITRIKLVASRSDLTE
jgi:hypothetical protein